MLNLKRGVQMSRRGKEKLPPPGASSWFSQPCISAGSGLTAPDHVFVFTFIGRKLNILKANDQIFPLIMRLRGRKHA